MEFQVPSRFVCSGRTACTALLLVLCEASAGWALPGSLLQLGRPDACVKLDGNSVECTTGHGLDGVYDVEISPDAKNVYAVALFDNAITVFRREALSGALTQLAAPEGCIAA